MKKMPEMQSNDPIKNIDEIIKETLKIKKETRLNYVSGKISYDEYEEIMSAIISLRIVIRLFKKIHNMLEVTNEEGNDR